MKELKQGDKVCFKVVWPEKKVLYIEGIIKAVSIDGADIMIFLRGLEQNFVFWLRSGEWIFYDKKTWQGLLMELIEEKIDFPNVIPEIGDHIAYDIFKRSQGKGIIVNFRYLLKRKGKIIEAGIVLPLVENQEMYYWMPAKWYQRNKSGHWYFKDEKNKRFKAKVEKI